MFFMLFINVWILGFRGIWGNIFYGIIILKYSISCKSNKMTFKGFLKSNLNNILVCTTLLLPPIIMWGVPSVTNLYYSHQRNKDPVGYDQRIIKERIGQLEKRNSQISEHFNREPSLLSDLLSLPVKMVIYIPQATMDIAAFGAPIGLTEEQYMNECEIERLREAYSDLERQRDS